MSPVAVHEVDDVVQVSPPGVLVAVYELIGLPPVVAGAVHDTVAWASPAVAETPVGAPGGERTLRDPVPAGVFTSTGRWDVVVVPSPSSP